MRRPLLLALIVLLAVSAFAQPDPNNPQPDGRNQPRPPAQNALPMLQMFVYRLAEQQSTTMLAVPQGLFVLRSGVLIRLNPQTLEQQKLAELLPTLPPQPDPQNAQPEATLSWLREWARHVYPAVMLQEGNDLLILIGDQFIRVNAETLAPKFNVLAASQRLQQMDPNMRALELAKAPVLVRDPKGPLLYVTRTRLLTVLNVETGEVVAEKPLPEQLFVKPPQARPQGAPGGPGAPNPPPPGGNAPGAAPQPGNQAGDANRTITVVGTVVRHQEGGNIVWTLKADNGVEAVLTGPQAGTLTQTPNIAGSRVRVTGTYTAKSATTPQYAAGNLEVQKYEVLPA